MKKVTVQKTYFYTKDKAIFQIFGLNGDNQPMIIKEDDLEFLGSYIEDIIEEGYDEEIRDYFNEISQELEKVNEVQVLYNDSKGY